MDPYVQQQIQQAAAMQAALNQRAADIQQQTSQQRAQMESSQAAQDAQRAQEWAQYENQRPIIPRIASQDQMRRLKNSNADPLMIRMIGQNRQMAMAQLDQRQATINQMRGVAPTNNRRQQEGQQQDNQSGTRRDNENGPNNRTNRRNRNRNRDLGTA